MPVAKSDGDLDMANYKINVNPREGFVLTFLVMEYELKEGMCFFTDLKTNKIKGFPTTICEISEI